MENEPAGLIFEPMEKALIGLSLLGVVDRWSATPKQARYSALVAFS